MEAVAQSAFLGRYEIIGPLGEGGYGAVYEARDRSTGDRIALKELLNVTGSTLASFKQEFRAVQEVHHPNLVRLDALFEDHGKWVIAMELVDGRDLLTYVSDFESELCFDEPRLRDAFSQLADALSALHAAGFVHRDLKPSNVRVTGEGRVVLLDFGLTTALDHSAQVTHAAGIGTLAYMAPEQAAGDKVDAAADWYAFGACLYEALTGVLPIEAASPLAMLAAKQQPLVHSPVQLAPAVPKELSDLCVSLLSVDKNARPSGRAVRSVLARHVSADPSSPAGPLSGGAFEGRELELRALEHAFATVQTGGCQVVLIEGESGIGKSALVERFLSAPDSPQRDALLLRSRCYENELLAYKAFDGAVDGLCRVLGKLEPAECRARLPARAGLLSRLFPALASVKEIARGSLAGVAADPGVQRLEAFAVFTRLLVKLSERQPIVIAIDDLQWADAESFRLWTTLLTAPDPPRCLFLATIRPRSELDQPVKEHVDALLQHSCASSLQLRGLPHANAMALARELLGNQAPESWLEVIVRESAGHPLFLTVLTRFAGSQDGVSAAELTLDAAITARLDVLPPQARTLLETVALVGSPQTAPLCGRAAGLSEGETARLVAELCGQKLLRRRRAGEIACFHDHIRRVAVQNLPRPTVRALHSQIAGALAARMDSDPTELARHYEGAGKSELAFEAYRNAAERAASGLAFDRVAALYARALDASAEICLPDEQRLSLLMARGDALARGGRSGEAAREYLAAAQHARGEHRTRLRISAAQHLLQNAQVAEGLAAARELLAELDVPLPSGQTATFARIAWDRVCLGMSGLQFDRENAAPSERARMQLDALWGLTMPVAWLDPLASAALSTRHLRLARASGSATHMARALAEEAFARTIQNPDDPEADVLLARARTLCDPSRDPALEVSIAFREATVSNWRWNLPRSRERLEHAQQVGTEHCPDQPWLLTNVRTALGTAWVNQCEFTRLATCTAAWVVEARSRNDQFAPSMIETLGFGFMRHLMSDDPDQARSAVATLIAPWPADPFSFAHFGELVGVTYTELYRGGEQGYAWIERELPRLSRAFVLKMGFGKACFLMFRAMLCLSARCVAQGQRAAQLDAEAHSQLRQLRKVKSALSTIYANAMDAQLAALAGDPTRALELAGRARAQSLESGGVWLAESLAYLEGAIEGGEHGRDKQAAVLARYEAQGWKNPRSGLRMLCPLMDALGL